MDVWQRITLIGQRQHGVVTHRDLARLGVREPTRRSWVRRGLLERAAPGVCCLGGTPATWEQRIQIGLSYLGDRALVSHEAAARLHGFDRTPADPIEFLVPRAVRRRSVPEGRVHTTERPARIDRVRVEGFPVTSATRTVLDLAMQRPGRARLEAAIDSAVRHRSSAPEVLQRRLAQLRGSGRWGCRLVDQLTLDAGGESMLERRFLELMRAHGLPRPTTQRWFHVEKRPIGRADFVYAEHRMVVEVSGRKGHASDAERAKDAQRRNELQDIGWRVYEYTWDDVTCRPAHVVRTMRERLGVGAA